MLERYQRCRSQMNIDFRKYWIFGMRDFSRTWYGYIDNSFLSAFVEIWHTDESSFHLSIVEISITLNEVSCLLHLPIIGILLEDSTIYIFEALDLMVTQLWVDAGGTQKKIEDTRRCHARFSFLTKKYIDHLNATVNLIGYDAQVVYHKQCALKTYFLLLVNTCIFVDKVKSMSILYTLNTSLTWSWFTSIIGG